MMLTDAISFLLASQLAQIGPPPAIFAANGSPPITFTEPASNYSESTSSATSIASSSISFAANRLYLVAVQAQDTGAAVNTTSVTGAGMTWQNVGTIDYNTAGTPLTELSVWRSMTNAATSGAITANFNLSADSMHIWIVEVSNTDTSGSNGSGAIVQTKVPTAVNASTANQTITFDSAYGNSKNAAIAFFGGDHSGTAYTAAFEAGWTEIEDNGINNPSCAIAIGTMLLAADTSCTVTNTTSKDWGGIMVEIKTGYP